jgi:hypothetical protein
VTMPSGGARNRSGPQADPNSLRSAQRGLILTALPSEGYRGEIPEFPLPPAVVVHVIWEGKAQVREFDEGETALRREREAQLWEWAWRTPQACAWAREPWRWQSVAMWVRTMGVCESADALAADKNSLHRFADQIGLTPAGLRENGWAISKDELDNRHPEKAPVPVRASSRGRLKVVGGGDGD